MHAIYNEKIDPPSDPNEVRCFGVYGCFAGDKSCFVKDFNKQK